MKHLSQRVAAAARSVTRVSRLRLSYEIGLILVCGLGSVLMALYFTDDSPWGSRTATIVLAVISCFAWAVVVPLRLVRPLTALLAGALLTLPLGGAGIVLIPLSASVGYRSRRWLPVAATFLFAFGCSVAGIALTSDFSAPTLVLSGLGEFSAFVLVPATVGAMLAQRRLLVMTMHQRNLELHAERQAIEGQAQVRERNRIAAELHDSLGHRLTLISLYAGGLAQGATPTDPVSSGTSTIEISPERQQALGLLRDTSAQAMGELRQILRILHQDASEEAGGRSLAEVEETVASARGTGTQVELVRAGVPRPLNLLAEHAAYRVVQEGLTNALKHAGGAAIRVEVRYEDEELFVEVRNGPGRPYTGQSTGQGLAGLAERVRLAGGVLSSGPMDGGFRISAVLPYDAEIPGAAQQVGAGDFPEEIARNTRRQRLGVLAVIAAVILSLGSCVGAVVVPDSLGSELYEPVVPSGETVSQLDFDVLKEGDEQAAVQADLPDPWHSEKREDGTLCEYYTAGPDVEPVDDFMPEADFEFCFRDGRLLSKEKL